MLYEVITDALSSLTADLSGLPAGHDAVFTPAGDNASGTLTWTPTHADSGSHTIVFTAANDSSQTRARQQRHEEKPATRRPGRHRLV